MANLNNDREKQCFYCGVIYTSQQYEFYAMRSILDNYKVCNNVNLCSCCAIKVNVFISYWGEKHKQDLDDFRAFLLNGVIPLQEYNSMMYGGYFG